MTGRIVPGLWIAAALVVAVFLGALLRGAEERRPIRATLPVSDLLSGADTAGFARASGPRPFRFPADHGPHPTYRHEWWYFTGTLESDVGRRFGFQLTFFRNALSAEAEARASKWAANQVYMAHFAVTDVEGKRFYSAERFSRGALGLAGARAEPFRVWLEDWSAEGVGGRVPPIRLRAAGDSAAVDLRLERGKPMVLQGEDGWSRKGPEPGNASYYYSYTRMPARGTVRVGGRTFRVQGTAWMDREWGTSALGPDQVGWDWFSLQLSDGRELMYYQLRRNDGSADPLSRGTLVESDGATRALTPDDVELEVLAWWTSPGTGVSYPARWRLRIPDAGLDLTVAPLLADQELDHTVRYWEGAVRVEGRSGRDVVTGRGYVELTGYTAPAEPGGT